MRWVSAFGVSLLAYAFLILCYIIVSKRSATELLDTASEIIRRRGHKCQLIKSSSTNHSYSLKPYYWAAYDDFDRFSSLISSRRALFISEGDQHITARNNNSNDKKRRTRRISVLQVSPKLILRLTLTLSVLLSLSRLYVSVYVIVLMLFRTAKQFVFIVCSN